MYALINPCNLICNMQLNVLKDLAEAMKALDGKKKFRKGLSHAFVPAQESKRWSFGRLLLSVIQIFGPEKVKKN